MRKHFKIFSLLFILTAILILPYFVFAQSSANPSAAPSMLGTLDTVAYAGGYTIDPSQGLMVVVGTIISAVLSLLGAVFIIFLIYAGIQWMTAAGNETKVEKAQTVIKTSVIGLIITLSSWAIWNFIFRSFIVK